MKAIKKRDANRDDDDNNVISLQNIDSLNFIIKENMTLGKWRYFTCYKDLCNYSCYGLVNTVHIKTDCTDLIHFLLQTLK